LLGDAQHRRHCIGYRRRIGDRSLLEKPNAVGKFIREPASYLHREAGLANPTYPLLNTFVPNLVWLPSQIAKLSDIEGGIVQQTLQAVSRRVYGDLHVDSHLKPIVAKAWSMLPQSAVAVDVELSRLNWFVATDRFLATRKARLSSVIHDRYGHLFPDDLDAVADAFDTAADALRTVGAFKPVAVAGNSL
jgi:hypothetical protein